ncbi:hypothetical protein [Nocardia abscessus]|uniref:hypothetical protein n=1 Tax=Nocardia abscessus TaxID=120957 RepID=UPI002458ADB8|nr:hypothetical protein [Nocardia abscessus]
MPEPENLHHFRGHSSGLQSCEFFGAFLVRCLACFARFLLRSAGVGCCPLQTGSVGRVSGRQSPSVDGFPFLELIGHWEFLRHPFGGLTLDPRTLRLRRLVCLPGSLGFFSHLSILLDSLGGFGPAARSAVAGSQHVPELFGSLACSCQLSDFLPTIL